MKCVLSMLSLVLAATLAPPAHAVVATYEGVVTAIAAPDKLSITINGDVRDFRLYGVDCPEPGQPFHEEALAYVTEKALDKTVTIEVLATDSLGLEVVRVILPGYVNLNNTLLSKGLGWWDEPNAPEDGVLKRDSAKALIDEAGLWSEAAPLAPWDYRKSHEGEEYSYSVAPKVEETPMAEAEDETPTLSASGKGRYVEKENAYSAKDLNIDPASLDINTLIGKHQPRIATGPDGQPLGLTASAINDIPGAAQLGFQDGDVITGLNGDNINSLGQVYGLIEKNRNAKQFQVNILRNGRPITINISP